jgi:hypothetical protein
MKLVELNRKPIWLEIYTRQVITAKKQFIAVPSCALAVDDYAC